MASRLEQHNKTRAAHFNAAVDSLTAASKEALRDAIFVEQGAVWYLMVEPGDKEKKIEEMLQGNLRQEIIKKREKVHNEDYTESKSLVRFTVTPSNATIIEEHRLKGSSSIRKATVDTELDREDAVSRMFYTPSWVQKTS